jgi:predicted alpha/beta-hydrolase family hydrolase
MTRSSDELVLDTPEGPARAVFDRAPDPSAALVLGHGAGGGIEAPDLAALARHLPSYALTVVRVEQPWRLKGRKVASPPPTLDRAWLAVVPALGLDVPLVVGGRSAGARVACRTAAELGAVGALCLAFPLHPPGRPERSRLPELQNAGVPTLVVQGDRDSFGRPEEFPPATNLRRFADGDHGLGVPARSTPGRAERLRGMAADVGAWISSLGPHPS